MHREPEWQGVLPGVCKLGTADKSTLPSLEEMSHSRGQDDVGSKMGAPKCLPGGHIYSLYL